MGGGGDASPSRLRAVAVMTVGMLRSSESEQQLVGARCAAGAVQEAT